MMCNASFIQFISLLSCHYIFSLKKNLRHHCHSNVLQLNYLYSSNIEKKKRKRKLTKSFEIKYQDLFNIPDI
jgi:hypothetical protein